MAKFVVSTGCVLAVLFLLCSAEGEDEKPTNDKLLLLKLNRPLTIEFRRMPLYAAFEAIGKSTKTRITLDGVGLKSEGYTRNMAQTAKFERQPARLIIQQILKQYESMVLCIDRADGSFVVTTVDAAKKRNMETVQLVRASDASRRLMSKETLARQLKREIAGMKLELKDWKSYRRHLPTVQNRLTTIIVLAEVAENYGEEIAWSTNTQAVIEIARELRKPQRTTNSQYMKVKEGVAEIERLVAGGRIGKKPNPVRVGESDLPLLMRRMDMGARRLKDVIGAAEPTDAEIQAAIDDANLMAVIATSIQTIRPNADEADWGPPAKRLATSSHAVTDVKTLKTQFAVMMRVCDECHSNFR